MTPVGWPLPIVLVFLFLYGTVIGSFLNVCIHRIPLREGLWDSLKGLWSPPSRCPHCFHRIPSRDNIPIFGWLLLLGRCRFCRAKISIRYPLIELFNGLLFLLVYWMEVPSGWLSTIAESCLYTVVGPQGFERSSWLSPTAVVHWRYFYHMVLLEALVVATFIDFDLRIIPDGSTLPAMAVGMLGALAIGQVHLVPIWYQGTEVAYFLQSRLPDWMQWVLIQSAIPAWVARYPHWHGLAVSLAGLIVGGGMIWAVRLIGGLVLRREAMGFGDVILMAMIGSFLGWQPTVVVFFLAPVCALVFALVSWIFLRHREIPYGPYLSIATLVVILVWDKIWSNKIWLSAERVFAFGPLLPVFAVLMTVGLLVSLLLVQGAKRLIGLPLYPVEELTEAWTSADQLTHFSGEWVDLNHGSWRSEDRSVSSAGRGTAQIETWRRSVSDGWKQNWSRRPSSR